MAEQVKRPLMVGQYAWTVSKKDGRFKPIVGPDPLEATDDDIFVVPDAADPIRVAPVDHPAAAIRNFVTLGPTEYAVIVNPTESQTLEYPNGQYSSGRGEMKSLRYGTKRITTAGHFPLWPGQRVEVRTIHHLFANQFVMVVVESAQVDKAAPYFELTAQCARIKKAVVDETVASKDGSESIKTADIAADSPPKNAICAGTPLGTAPQEAAFQVGQRIIIPGSLTPRYIPPSGIEVVPDESGQIVREAVVLGPTEFCVLLDEDGRPQTKQGPGRVFPGPYDRFRTEGSRNRVYDAYHLRGDRGLLVRVVVDNITGKELAEQLPAECGSQLEKEVYLKGDEIFLGGFGAYLVPINAVEVVDPRTRRPHVGNDHSTVYVQAIGVDQKSGIYVANVGTGNVELMKGEKRILLDPRRQKHVHRSVPGRMWNLMIGEGEPHKRVAPDEMVDTPWALSVTVPNNTAVLVTSKDGRRPVVGPCMELLGYEEWLEVLTLSRGRPKTDEQQLETTRLRVTGNRITDQVALETGDAQLLAVDVSYGVEFVGESDEERAKWFNYKDYVMLLCANLRSRLRAAAHRVKLADLRPLISDFVRDTILGSKPKEEGAHRPGLLFRENNMFVDEVEVLSLRIPDEEIAQRLSEADRGVVMRGIEDVAREVELESERRRNVIDAELAAIRQAQIERQRDLELARIQSAHLQEAKRQELDHTLRLRKEEDAVALAVLAERGHNGAAELARTRKAADDRLRITLQDEERRQVLAHRQTVAQIKQGLIDAMAKADVSRLQAIEPPLIKAIEGLGDKQLATALAEHLPQATGALGLLLGQGGIAALKRLAEGTPMADALDILTESSSQAQQDAQHQLPGGRNDPEPVDR
jgi:major vault protein